MRVELLHMNTISERLLLLRGKTKQGDFAKALQINPNTLRNYENGRVLPNQEILERICVEFSVSAEWLLTGRGPMHIKVPQEGVISAPSVPRCETDLVLIPRVAARLAAGSGSLETGDYVEGHYAFRSDWIRRKGNVSQMVLMNVTGDSMLPRIENGDIVLIDQANTSIVAYGLYAVGVEDAVYVKELRTRPRQLLLHSLNPAYEDIEIDMGMEQPESIRIIGRVIWVGRELT